MASLFRSGPSRRKAEVSSKLRIQFKEKTSKAHSDSDVEEIDDDGSGDDDDNLPVIFGNGVSDNLSEGTAVGHPEAAEEAHGKKKPPARIDTSVLNSVSCSACGRQLNPYKNGAVQKHAQLKVVICKHCSKFLSSGEISKDQDGADEQCRWCGEGGRLLVCDDCSSAFCKSCVMRNFSRSEFNNINSQDNWLCYLCNPKPLKSLQENYRKIRDTLKALQEKQKAKIASSAASPASTTSPHSKKNVDSKQSSKNALIASNAKGRGAGANSVSSEASASMTLLSSEDLNVGHEHVDATIDKLTTATNTLRDVLQALRSQTLSSAAGSVYTEQKRKQQARALNKSLETFLKSLKRILTESDLVVEDGDEDQVQNLPPTKSTTSSLAPKSHLSSRPTTTSGSLPKEANATNRSSDSKKSVLVQQISTESNGGSDNILDITQVVDADKHRSKHKDTPNSVEVNMNGDVIKKKGSVNSGSDSSIETSDSKIASSKNSSRSSKDRTKYDDSDGEESAGKRHTVKNSDKSHSKSKVSDKNEASQNHSRKEKQTEGKVVKETLEKESVSENGSEDEAEIDNDASVDSSAKEKAVSSTPDDENLAAKFDLIKEIADEITRDNQELDQENEDNEGNDGEEDDLPIMFGEDPKSKPDGEIKTGKRKKAPDSSSDEDAIKTEKKSKKTNSSEPKKPTSETNNKKAKQEKKPNQVSEVSDSSSDPLSSGDDDTALGTRRKTRKATGKEKQKTARKDVKTTSPKQPAVKTKKRSEKEEKPSEMDEIDKEIAKLAKRPTMRKRKAADTDEGDESAEEKEDTSDKGKEKPLKRAKPGPKSSKKAVDYDDLSSDGHEGKDHDDDEVDEDEDELPVTFFGNTEEVDEQQDFDENEIAKKGLLEEGLLDDNESENDDNEEAEGESSSDEESESTKKTKKGKKKIEPVEAEKPKNDDGTGSEKDGDGNSSEQDNDSDENIGKRKKVHSKLLDAKLSDSDSDVVSKKKKKNAKAGSNSEESETSSGSSSDSNLSDEDDSDDSEDEDSETKSKKKGKKKGKKGKRGKGKKSEEEDDSSEDDGKKNKKGKGKTRRRIKKMSNSSDEGGNSNDDDDDDDDPDNSKAGTRKQIRKVMSSKKLEDATRAAAKAEEKRRKRIAAKQREFNIETITDENNPMNVQITTKLVLEAGKEEGDEPIIEVSKKLVCKLKPHQVEGVQFLWDCLYESVKRAKKGEGAGCILAHCMGLGKTLSVIAFVHTILTHQKILKHRTCLIVSPLNTVLNWKNEWSMWFDEEDRLEVWELAGCKQNALRAKALRDWQNSGGIMIIGYEMYRNLTTGNRCKNKKQKAAFQETLVDPGPDLVICDEGHILKNEASAISKAMNRMRTRRRVVLTGTPLQNNLTEYHCMLSFVKPNLLGTRREFTNRFISPIQNGQCTDSTQGDVKLMKARAHVLHEMLAGCVQRRDYSALTKFLPPKQEYVISVRLTSIQIELYEKYLELSGQGVDGVYNNKGARLFGDYQNLMKIWTHPWVLKLAEIRDELKAKYDDEDSFIDDDGNTEDEMSFSSSSSSSEDDKAGSDSGEEGTSSKAKGQKGTRRTRAKARRAAGEDSDPEEVITEWKTKSRVEGVNDVEEQDKTITRDWWAAYVTEDDKLKLELSNKLFLLFEILRMCEEIGDKVLIFSQSILSLNIIESFLEVIDAKFQQECENLSEEDREKQGLFGRSWTKNLDYYRMDGTTSAQNRQNWATSFNDIDNYRARLFLISTRAGGLGINLVAANRVIIFDASWNPSHDVQSIFRVYRFGQTKPCYIYRFLAQGTMEEKIYERQVTKLSLSQRVVDEHQIERHFSANDLKELYNFRPDRWDDGTEKPTLALPKDPLLAEILTNNKQCVVSFHEHDSLLENQVEQTLTEEEKKAAWEEYENEKKGIIVRGPGMDGKTSSWPMMAAAQLLSREQIAATVHALREQLPDVSENLFQLHLQQALRRQVQIKQEELKRLELLRLQELNYLNMMKQHNQLGGMSHAQMMQNMPWLQQMRALQQNSMAMGGSRGQVGMNQTATGMNSNNRGQTSNNPISNKPEEAIDLDDN